MVRTLGRLYIVTDRRAGDVIEIVACVLARLPVGAALVQLRDKQADGRELAAIARELLAVTRAHAAPLLINDRVDVAMAVGADGVHLPATSFSVGEARALLGDDAVIGQSTHSAAEAAAAARAGANVIVCGPVWATPDKLAYGAPLGLAELQRATGAVAAIEDAAVFAIGGIEGPERVAEARAAGAHGVAGIRAFADPDAVAAMFAILES